MFKPQIHISYDDLNKYTFFSYDDKVTWCNFFESRHEYCRVFSILVNFC